MNEKFNNHHGDHASKNLSELPSSNLSRLSIENCDWQRCERLNFQKLNEIIKPNSQIKDKLMTESKKCKSLDSLASVSNNKNHNFSDLDFKQLQKENDFYKSKVEILEKEKVEIHKKLNGDIEELKTLHQQQIDKISKLLDSKTKELEHIVVKYAISEKQIIDAQKSKNDFEKKIKDIMKDKDSLLVRVKGLSNEKQSLIKTLDNKISEIGICQKEIERTRKQLKEKEAQLMQFEFKLNKEQENQTKLNKKLEQSLKQIDELNNELSEYRSEKSIEIETANTNKINLESKCKEVSDLKINNSKLDDQIENQFVRIKQLELENKKLLEDKKDLTSSINELKQEIKVNMQNINANEHLKIDLDDKVEKLNKCLEELEILRRDNEELVTESKAYRQKEGELLEFTDRLQTKTVQLQSEHNHYKTRCGELEEKFNELEETITKQTNEINKLKNDLSNTFKLHQNEINLLAKKLAEESNLNEKLKRHNEELENENKIMKKKHLQSVKELNKELVNYRKKVEQYSEQPVEQMHPSTETISLSSRTNSSNSLERSSNGLNENQSTDEVIRTSFNNQILNPNFGNQNDIAQQLDKNVLLNKILTLQQQTGKLRSRIEFLEEHNNTLLEDLKKKTKLIQNFILKQEANCLSSNDMDNFKNQISKGTGVMASLYRNCVNDSNMTLELSLEINNKLQTVLEDTILKNITLKENIDTLGAEIEKMSKK